MAGRRKMKVWKKVALWTAGTLIVVIVAGLFALNYAMDRMLASLGGLDDTSLEELFNEVEPAGGELRDADSDNTGAPGEEVEPEHSEKNGQSAGQTGNQDAGHKESSGTSQSDQGGAGKGQGKKTPQDKPASQSVREYTAEVTTEKAKQLQDEVTLKEKAIILSTLTKRLTSADINRLRAIASGGLSVKEKKEARDLMLERLTEEEYDMLIEIASKYGLSQGKKYSEVKKR